MVLAEKASGCFVLLIVGRSPHQTLRRSYPKSTCHIWCTVGQAERLARMVTDGTMTASEGAILRRIVTVTFRLSLGCFCHRVVSDYHRIFPELGWGLPSIWGKDLSVAQFRRTRKVRRNGGRIFQDCRIVIRKLASRRPNEGLGPGRDCDV